MRYQSGDGGEQMFSRADIDAAAEMVLEGQQAAHPVSLHVETAWAAVLALRSSSLPEYVGAMGLTSAAREQDLERRHASEQLALMSLGVTDLEAAHRAVAHLRISEAVEASGSTLDEWDAALLVVTKHYALERKQRRWEHVRGRAEQTRQPRGGLLPLDLFERHDLGGEALSTGTEAGNASLVGSAVELLVRLHLAGDVRAACDARVAALETVRAVRRGEHLESGLGITAASRRDRTFDEFDEVDWEEAGDQTLEHVATMAGRTLAAFRQSGQLPQPETLVVRSARLRLGGFVDFASVDTLWDLKVSTSWPSPTDVLQLALYWSVIRDDPASRTRVEHLGIVNPRLDIVCRIAVADILPEVERSFEAVATAKWSPAAPLRS